MSLYTVPTTIMAPAVECGAPCEQFHMATLEEVLTMPDPEFLVDGIIFERALGVMFGQPKNYKSFIGLDMALSIASGRPWQGRKVKQGPTLYISGEGQGGLKKRIRAWMKRHGVEAEELDGFRMLPVPVKLLDSAQVENLIVAIQYQYSESGPPVAIFVDTLARALSGGEENSAKDMGQAVESAQKLQEAFNSAVVLVHHSNKSKRGDLRGSSALEGALDVAIKVTKEKAAPPTVKVECHNIKDADCFETIRLVGTSMDLDDGQTSLVFRDTSVPLLRLRKGSRQLVTLTILVESGAEGLTYTEWRNRSKAKGIAKSTFQEHVTDFVSDGLVKQPEERRKGARYTATTEGVAAVRELGRAA